MSLDALFAQLTSSQISGAVIDTSLIQADDFNLEESRTYNFRGAKMSADVGVVLPVVYGRHVVAPNLINVFVEEGENETLNMLLAFCEGEIESISNIKINGASIESFFGDVENDSYGENSELSVRLGTHDQAPIENFGDIHNIVGVGHTLKKGVPYIYTTGNPQTEAFKLEIYVNQLFQTDGNDNKFSWYVALQVESRLKGESVWNHLGIHEFNKKTESSFKRYFKSEYLTPGEYEIRITRVSDNSDATHIGEVSLGSVDEITTQNLSYPSTAVAGVRIVGSEKLEEELPNVTGVITGQKVRVPYVVDGLGNQVGWEDYYWDASSEQFKLLSNDTVLVWDGTYTIAWSGNPAWCIRDLLLNTRYGLGQFIDEDYLSEESFLASAKYFDEGVTNLNGNKEKRMKLDIVLDTGAPAPDRLYTLCQACRGLLFTSGGKVRLSVEKQQDAVQTFNMGNIVRDSFSIKYISDKAIPNVLELFYTNKDKNYSRDSIEISDETIAQEKIRSQSIQFIGCTRVSQALREGKIFLNKMKHNTKQIFFNAGRDAITCQSGDVINFQHDLPAWGEGSRIARRVSTTQLKLDKAITLDNGITYEIEVRNSDTDETEVRTIITPAGTTDEIEVSAPFSFSPKRYDLWNFGEEDHTHKLYRIVSLDEDSGGIVSIVALEYNASVYDYSGVVIPDDEYVYLRMEIPNVTNLVGEESVTRLEDGTIDNIVNVSYTRPPTGARWVRKAVKFEVWFSDNGGASWEFAGETDKDSFSVRSDFAVGKRYSFAVVSVTEDGERKTPATSPQIQVGIEGWVKAPGSVQGFTYAFEDEIKFDWDKSTEQDIAGYEIRTEIINWGNTSGGFIWRGKADSYTVVRPTARGGVTYYIKAYNTSGVYSDEAVILVPVNPIPGAVGLSFNPLFQKAFLFWDDLTDADLVEYEVWQNKIDFWAGEEVDNERLISKSIGTSASVGVPFDPTYYRVRGVDKFGAGEWSNVVEISPVKLLGSDVGDGIIREVHIGDYSITSPKIQSGAILAEHIRVGQVSADKLNVGELSAISANMGTITAGNLIGACIRTSTDTDRMEMNDTGLYSYDKSGNLRVKLTSGEICFIDPTSPGTYSYLDHGALKFQTPYGSVPYAKRLCQGTACAGTTVTLPLWTDKPYVSVGLRRLTSYDPDYSAQKQEWCVFADNYRYYDAGVGDFGWKFDVHAKLAVSGGVRDECIYLYNFDTVATTGISTCQLLVKEMFQLWCHDTAPANYYYGHSCFKVQYRLPGHSSWCYCRYEYSQPHATLNQMQSTEIQSQTVQLPYPAKWEVQVHESAFEWLDSGIASGEYNCYSCCEPYTEDKSYWTSCTYPLRSSFAYQIGHGNINNNFLSETRTFAFGAWDTERYPVCQSRIQYTLRGNIEARRYLLALDYSSASVTAQYGGVSSVAPIGYQQWISRPLSIQGGTTRSGFVNTFDVTTNLVVRTGYIKGYQCAVANAQVDATLTICYKVCDVKTCWRTVWYCDYVGSPASCEYRKFYSMAEVTSAEEILDPSGLVNYLAVAYA